MERGDPLGGAQRHLGRHRADGIMADRAQERLIDLSHEIEDGMTTFKGLPGPHICDYWTREESACRYDDGSTFQIGRIDMVANTGTYVDSPFHRYAEGKDLAGLPLESLADLDGLVVRRPFENGLAIDADAFADLDVQGKAVLVHTGWSRFWQTDAYFDDHPFLTEAAARELVEGGAAFVGIDSHNIDDTRARSRPVHSLLLGADIPIGEHLTGLDKLPDVDFRFSAVPPKVCGMGTFPVRAYARLT
jgi:kynurenine formamidase